MDKHKPILIVFTLALFSCFSVVGQEIKVPFKFNFSNPLIFSGVDYAIGMDDEAEFGLDIYDQDDITPPSGPVEVSSASFIIGNLNSTRDFRPVSRSATWHRRAARVQCSSGSA